jgi:asparagine synthase (glutamine-hydrolysing)
MCGILGIVDLESRPASELRPVLRRMGLWQYHRGPDGWGEWFSDGVALGQNRLAILDLVHGMQPMASEDGVVQVVFNGEIYNFRELWSELEHKGYRFRTDHSDTEVIVHGYREWGTGVFDRLEGMFGLAIWDAAKHSLYLARDRLGIKPLYYASTDQGILFASEPKTILAAGWLAPRLDESALADFFMYRAPVGPSTLFDGIKKVSAGCWCAYGRERGLGPEHRYWQPNSGAAPLAPDETEELITSALGDAARSHLAADVPVGLFLSGGVDSSLLASLVAQHARIEAFSVGTRSRWDESSFASLVADHLGLPLHIRWVTGEDFRSRLDDWSYFNDDPVADPSALALMLLTEHAREGGMKVMLAGEGADELFGGYSSYRRYDAYARLRRLGIPPAVRRLLGKFGRGVDRDYLDSFDDLRFFGSAHVMLEPDRRELLPAGAVSASPSWLQRPVAHSDATDPIRAAMLFDQAVRLPNDLLPRTDRATMAYSLEARVPYLDRRVVELANRLRPRDSIRLVPPRGKWLLKRIAARRVPRKAVYRHKRGFAVPVEDWLTHDFSEHISAFLDDRRIEPLNYDYLAQVRREHDAGRHRAELLWAWLVLEQWYRLWIGGEAVPHTPAVIADRDAYELLLGANGRSPDAASSLTGLAPA